MNAIHSSNPFVGLRPFESNESLLFFGRQDQTLELLQRLHQHHFVAVVGSSGSGKSSLIRAGLVPALKAGYLVNDRDRWAIAVMKPGQNPLYNLAGAVLGQLESGPDGLRVAGLLTTIKEEGSDAILDAIRHLWKEKNTNFFLLIDQFEELFRFSIEQKEVAKRDDAIDFVNIILELSKQTTLPVYIVITMRSDFIGDCAQFYGLPEAMNQSQYLVPRLNRVQLKNTIEGPVKLYGGSISAALISKVLNDVGTVKDELPLLQHALMRVWDYEENADKSCELDLHDYELVGGIEKALSNHADEALKGMNEMETVLTKKLFQALTVIDENGRKTRRPVQVKELEEITGAGREQILSIINRFIENKRCFLVVNKAGERNGEVIDISHESLIRQWSTLNGWVDEEADSAKTYVRLSESAELYKERKKDLLMGNELQQMLEWYYTFKPGPGWAKKYSANNEENIGYLKESERAEKRSRNNRKMIVGGVIVAITSVALILFFAYQKAEIARRDAIAQREANQNQLATNYWNSSQDERAEKKLAEALHFIAEGVSISKAGSLTGNMLLDIAPFLPRCSLKNIIHHESAISTVAFSPDGKWILTADADGSVSILDAESGKQVGKKIKHTGTVNSAVFSPDGKQILTAGRDSTARVWDTEGRQIGAAMKHGGAVNSAVFSPDGKWILTASDDKAARIWDAISDVQTGRAMLHEDAVNSAVFSPDGTQVLTASDDSSARLWDAAGDMPAGPRMRHADYVNSAVFSPDGKQVLTACADGSVRIWDASSSLQTGLVIQHEDEVNSAVFSPDGKEILTASDDSTARLWDAESGVQIGPEMEHEDYVNSAVFSPGGKGIVTAGRDSAVRIWDAVPAPGVNLPMKQEGVVISALFSPDSKRVLTAGLDGTARLWYAGSGIQAGKDMKHEGILFSAVFSPDGKQVLTAGYDKTARIWDVGSGRQIGQDMKHERAVRSAVFSPDGKWILTASLDGTARLWDARSGKPTGVVMKHEDAVRSAVFSPDGKQILTASRDSTARLWDARNGRQTGPAMRHAGILLSAVFSPDGKLILTASDDKTARLWEAGSGREVGRAMKHGGAVNSAVFSPDGKWILTASDDKTVRVWDAANSKQVGRDMVHEGAVNSAVFSPDGTEVLSASRDSTARLWNAKSGKQIGLAMKQAGAVNSAVFSANGTQLLTAGADKTARIWDAGTDMDIPGDLFKLQAKACTGYELNIETGKIEIIPYKEWDKLKEQYNQKAKEHYKTCRYRKHNFWSLFNPEDAGKLAAANNK